MRVLLVEDTKEVREGFQLLLEDDGAHVTAVASGRWALALAASQPFDVVLTDYSLPDIAGDLLVRELRRRVGESTPLIVVTGSGEPYLTRARSAGADAVFNKPVDWDRVLDQLISFAPTTRRAA